MIRLRAWGARLRRLLWRCKHEDGTYRERRVVEGREQLMFMCRSCHEPIEPVIARRDGELTIVRPAHETMRARAKR